MRNRLLFFCLFLSFALQVSAQDAIWQWKVDVRNFSSSTSKQNSRAFLWIPENCQRVEGIIIAQHNMEEISILEDEVFRSEMSKLNFAEVWCAPSFNHTFDFTDGAIETLNGLLNDLAQTSGYKELSEAPLIAIGHSATASWPYYLAVSLPKRTLACISVSGQWPYSRHPSFAKDIWGDKNIDYIPCLETMGEYESAQAWSDRGLKERKEHPLLPLSMLACPAEGHFAYTPEKAAYIALYIRKAIEYGHMNPIQTGWLVERWKKDKAPVYQPAPVNQYAGDKEDAFWFFDKEMADATTAYQARFRGMASQLLGVEQQGVPVVQKNTHLQLHLEFTPEEDGRTLHLKPIFLDTVPGESPRLKSWTGLPVGTAIGYADCISPISIQRICGPFQVVNSTTLCVKWNRYTPLYADKDALYFALHHPGDNKYKPAVQQAQIDIPLRKVNGVKQVITFPEIKDIKREISQILLNAVSDAKLPVGYFVVCGPATIDGNVLTFTKIPPRTKFPVKVTVIAYQYGNNQTQTAQPVERTFHIQKQINK